jgi:hypothetical protein
VRDNALDVVYVPATFDSPAACMMRAQAYVANSSIGRDLTVTVTSPAVMRAGLRVMTRPSPVPPKRCAVEGAVTALTAGQGKPASFESKELHFREGSVAALAMRRASVPFI